MNVVSNRIVAVQDRVCDYLMKRFSRVDYRFQSFCPKNLNVADDLFGYPYRIPDEIIGATLNTNGVFDQSIPSAFRLAGLIPVYFDAAPLGQDRLRQVRE